MIGSHGDGWWILMWVWMATFWLLVLAGATWFTWSAQRRLRNSAADGILNQRLARGEIDPAQYRALAQELEQQARTSFPISGRVLAAIAALAVVAVVVAPVIALTRSDWDMFDHMGRMMRGGSDTTGDSLTIGSADETVEIDNFAFSPGNLRVPVGATVTWTNNDSTPHDATSRDGSWSTSTLRRGDSESVTFDVPGEYDYYCSIHASMKAHLSVT